MKIIKKGTKILVVDINSIFYFITFIIFLGFIIFFISLGIKDTDISMQLTKVYSQDQANAINALADSTIARISNTIAITAIFFTVIVASISVFQILKFKDFEKMKQSILSETVKFDEDIMNLKEELQDLQIYKEKLYKHNVELEIKFYIFKINTWYENIESKNVGFTTTEFINMIKKVLFLSEMYPDLIGDEELANMYYYKYCVSSNDIKQIREENIIGIRKAIELIKDKNILVTRKYTRALMLLYQIDNSNKNVQEEFQEIIDLIDQDIADSIWLIEMKLNCIENMNDEQQNKFIDDIITEIKILSDLYGNYAMDKIKMHYDNYDFDKLLKNNFLKNTFLKFINEIKC